MVALAVKEFGLPQLRFRNHWTDSCLTLSKTVISLSNLSASEASKHACPIRAVTPWADGIFPKASLMGPLSKGPVVRAERREGTRNEAGKMGRSQLAQVDYLTGEPYERLHGLIYVYIEDGR